MAQTITIPKLSVEIRDFSVSLHCDLYASANRHEKIARFCDFYKLSNRIENPQTWYGDCLDHGITIEKIPVATATCLEEFNTLAPGSIIMYYITQT